MADYFSHWLEHRVAQADATKLARLFYVDWFRKDADGKYSCNWPGFGENSRVLEWVFERCAGRGADAVETPIGYLPCP